MTKDDALVSRDLLDIFDLEVGDQVLIRYDFLSFLPGQFQTFENIIFEEIPKEDRLNNRTRGQMFLIAAGVRPNVTFGEIKTVARTQLGLSFDNLTAGGVGLLLGYTDNTLFSIMLDDLFRQLQRNDFVLSRNYTVLAVSIKV